MLWFILSNAELRREALASAVAIVAASCCCGNNPSEGEKSGIDPANCVGGNGLAVLLSKSYSGTSAENLLAEGAVAAADVLRKKSFSVPGESTPGEDPEPALTTCGTLSESLLFL